MNPNDIYLEQVNNHGTFTETYMSVIPNGIVVADSASHLIMVASLPSTPTASYVFTSSYSITASYAMNGGGGGSGSIVTVEPVESVAAEIIELQPTGRRRDSRGRFVKIT